MRHPDITRKARRRLRSGSTWLAGLAGGLGALATTAAAQSAVATAPPADSAPSLEQAQVTASRLNLLGTASSASEGTVTDDELQLTPQYRPGQLLETVPGLIVTLHSGEGKANQFLMRGYNLDHGTDLETYIDGMPINQPTHAHGQGYTDLNFLIPELADGLTFTKGPYYAPIGDFGAVGSVHMDIRDTIADQVSATAGTLGYQRLLAAGTQELGGGARLLAAGELQHYDGPFVVHDDARKENAVLRLSRGDEQDGYSLTAMYYHQLWTNTTDIPLRAIDEGIVPNRFGSLDPSDGGHAQRSSLSAQWHKTIGEGSLTTSLFFIDNQLHLYNDFTHFLFDPVHGDQEDQYENRHADGGSVKYRFPAPLFGLDNRIESGALVRNDALDVGRLPSESQVPVANPLDPASFSDSDHVNLLAAAAYVQATTEWTAKIRSVLGLREDYQHGRDTDNLSALHAADGYTNGGHASQSLLQPKASLIYQPTDRLELYLGAGEGFHSADLRGVNQDRSVDLGLPNTPLLARQVGEEAGVRAVVRKDLAFTLAVYNLWQRSETIIDPDVGQDSAGPPSRRFGFEINATWQIQRWLELYGSYSANRTRFTQAFDDGTGHLGTYITDAPIATGSLALYLVNLGPWSGGLNLRYLGDYPLSSGPCNDAAAAHDFPGATGCANAPTAPNQVNGKGFTQLNLDVHYAFRPTWTASIGVYNLLNSHRPAAQFWYVDRLQSETATYPNGRADIHEHPLEPIMARFTIVKRFEP